MFEKPRYKVEINNKNKKSITDLLKEVRNDDIPFEMDLDENEEVLTVSLTIDVDDLNSSLIKKIKGVLGKDLNHDIR